MLDVQAALTRAAYNEPNENWFVVPAEKVLTRNIFIRALITIVLFFSILSFVGLCSSLFTFDYDISLLLFLFTNPWMLLVYSLSLFAIVYYSWYAEKAASNAVLILVPEGIILCNRWSDEGRRKIKTFKYEDMETLTLRVEGAFEFAPAQTRELRIEEYIERVEARFFVFDIVYKNGKKQKWGIPEKYRTEQVKVNRIVQWIVTNYAAFVDNHSYHSLRQGENTEK